MLNVVDIFHLYFRQQGFNQPRYETVRGMFTSFILIFYTQMQLIQRMRESFLLIFKVENEERLFKSVVCVNGQKYTSFSG